jgi:hypothetical protein
MPNLVHEIHTSERKSFKGCRLRWSWHFEDQWTPIGMAPPLEMGIAYHKGMEVLYDPDTWDWDKEIVGELAVKAFVDTCDAQRKKYLKEANQPELEASVKEDYDARITLGKGMLRYFYRTQLPKYPENFRPVKVELGFEVPILHPDTNEPLRCKCDKCWERFEKVALEDDNYLEWIGYNAPSLFRKDAWEGLPVVYAGRIDCLGEDENGDYWIVDWKTARSISADDEFLELDDQIGSYVWALRAILGLPVRGFYYHEQKKGYPQPPAENVYLRKGCRFSVSKQQDTDYITFYTHIAEHDREALDAGSYDAFLEWLKNDGPKFHKRWQIVKSETQLENIGRNIALEALDILDPNKRIYPNAGRFSCKFCAFRQPCLGKFAGEDYEYTLQTLFRQEPPYYYRQERGPSTESKGGE